MTRLPAALASGANRAENWPAVDLNALAKVLEQARLRGDQQAVGDALRQLETEDLVPEPGEERRFRIAGMPPDTHIVQYHRAPAAPASFPPDLAWIPEARTSVTYMGGDAFAAIWMGVEVEAAVTVIMDHAKDHGWREPEGFRFATAAGVVPRYLEREKLTRQVIGVGGSSGMVQVLQSPKRDREAEAGGSPGDCM